MLRLLILFITFSLIVCCSNKNEKSIQFETVQNDCHLESICNLKENLGFLKSVSRMTFITDSTFAIISNKNVYIYNLKGDQISKLGNIGKGSGEYINPIALHLSEKHIYVWCSSSLRLLAFDRKGYNHHKTMIYNVKGVKKFQVINDHTVYFFGSLNDRNCVTGFNMTTGDNVGTWGLSSNQDQLMFMFDKAGALEAEEENLIYCLPSSLKIYSIRDQENHIITEIIDDHFFVEEMGDAKQHWKWVSHIFRSSSTIGIHSFNKTRYLLAETGEIIFNPTSTDFSTRKSVIYKMNEDFTPIEKRIFPNPQSKQAYCFFKDDLYAIHEKEDSLLLYRYELK